MVFKLIEKMPQSAPRDFRPPHNSFIFIIMKCLNCYIIAYFFKMFSRICLTKYDIFKWYKYFWNISHIRKFSTNLWTFPHEEVIYKWQEKFGVTLLPWLNVTIRDGNPAKKSADSDCGFYCGFFALQIRIPILIT